MKKPTSGTTDLTTGRPLTRILLFALPLVQLVYCAFAWVVISGVGELLGRSFGGWLALHGLGYLGICLANPIAWAFALAYCVFMVARVLKREEA